MRRLRGLAFVMALVTLMGLAVASYSGVFERGVPVTLEVDRAGSQLTERADVKVRGLIVGQVEEISTDGDGATVQLSLDPEMVDMIPATVSARVLVADPEVALAELICEALATDGHEAVAARDADDALARLTEEPFDLVISDALLPGLPAERLTGAIERHRPELRDRVLLTTGDWVGGEPEAVARRFGIELLRKPFEIDELRWAVRRQLAPDREATLSGS